VITIGRRMRFRRRICALICLSLLAGCGSSSAPVESEAIAAGVPPAARDLSPAETAAAVAVEEVPLPTISLNGAAPQSRQRTAAQGIEGSEDRRSSRMVVIAALQPLQTLLGTWRGTTRKEVGDFKSLDEPEWIWDLRTDRTRPALVMTSEAGHYFRAARLTWIPERGTFRLTATGEDGRERIFEGDWSEPVEEFQEAGSRVQKRFKLQLTEVGEAKDRWQLVLNQQNNDRYLLELSRIRGEDVFRFDTVGHQRQGTSFATSDSDYGERKCIISGGLGTIQVSYQGRTYWVCCTGCRDAFNEDPEGWLREAREKGAPGKSP
jgi:hypothetical protein